MIRRLASYLLTGLLLMMLLAPTVASAADRTHTVQYGETLTSIAAQFGVSVDRLAAANGIGSPNLIFVGQVLTIPGSSAPPAAARPSGGSYVVQPGDTLSGIAAQYGLDVGTLASANSLADTNYIWSGERLTIPSAGAPSAPATPSAPAATPAPAKPAAPPPATGNSYTVKAGDNLSTIAANYGVDVNALAQANGITNPNLLFSGTVLTIPGKSAAKPAAPSPTATLRPAATPPPPPAQAATPTLAAPPPGAQATPTLKVAPTPPPSKPQVVPQTGSATKYTVQGGDRLYSIAAKFNTTVDAIVARNNLKDANTIYPGQVLQIVVGDKVSKPAAAPQPSPTPRSITQPVTKPGNDKSPPVIDQGHSGKWIDVNLSTEELTAYEGNTPVFHTLVSTGVAWHPTVVGTFHIYAKYLADDMSGGTGSEYYYLPAVPYTMYFYEGYAIHGTYWHHNFGHPMSHGCVNLPTPAAEWMYNWAPIGTPVTTHW